MSKSCKNMRFIKKSPENECVFDIVFEISMVCILIERVVSIKRVFGKYRGCGATPHH